MYATDEYIQQYIQSLGEISKERPDLIKKCGEPSKVVNNIGGFIGYAPENPTAQSSYTDRMSDCLGIGMGSVYKEWLGANLNAEVVYNLQSVKLADVVSSGKYSASDIVMIQALGLEKMIQDNKFLNKTVAAVHSQMSQKGIQFGNSQIQNS